MIPGTFEGRRALIMTVARANGTPIWVGDVAPTPLTQEAIRPAINSLVKDGILQKQKRPGTARIYYSLAPTAPCGDYVFYKPNKRCIIGTIS